MSSKRTLKAYKSIAEFRASEPGVFNKAKAVLKEALAIIYIIYI